MAGYGCSRLRNIGMQNALDGMCAKKVTLEPVTQAIKNVYGAISQGISKGLKLRIDNGT